MSCRAADGREEQVSARNSGSIQSLSLSYLQFQVRSKVALEERKRCKGRVLRSMTTALSRSKVRNGRRKAPISRHWPIMARDCLAKVCPLSMHQRVSPPLYAALASFASMFPPGRSAAILSRVSPRLGLQKIDAGHAEGKVMRTRRSYAVAARRVRMSGKLISSKGPRFPGCPAGPGGVLPAAASAASTLRTKAA